MSKNATCFAPEAPQKGPPLFQHGTVVFQGTWSLSHESSLSMSFASLVSITAHDVGWIVSGIFTVIAIIASSWLINKHLQWCTNVRLHLRSVHVVCPSRDSHHPCICLETRTALCVYFAILLGVYCTESDHDYTKISSACCSWFLSTPPSALHHTSSGSGHSLSSQDACYWSLTAYSLSG
jgi:hypothetical protein